MRRISAPFLLSLAVAGAAVILSCSDGPIAPRTSSQAPDAPRPSVSTVPSSRLIWQNITSGERSFWVMQGASWDGSAAILPTVPAAWSIAGSGDFNADGNADILWQNTLTGERSLWFMNGNAYAGAAILPQVPAVWSIAGVGDFNADNNPDIVWQNTTTGERSIWFMNGSAYGSAALLPQVPTAWSISAVGDFNGDLKPDLVWQNAVTGERSVWFMNGSAFNGAALLPTVPTAWKIAGATDFDGDGNTDLVWQNTTTGERSIWNMTGSSFTGAVILPTVPTQWRIAGVMAVPTSGCSPLTSVQLAVGAVRTLTAAERASVCIGGDAVSSEYVLIPFNSTNVAASTISLQIAGMSTAAIQPGGLASRQIDAPSRQGLKTQAAPAFSDSGFRERELRDLASVLSSSRAERRRLSRNAPALPKAQAPFLVGVPVNPVVGSTVQMNVSLSGNTCTGVQLTNAVVVAVLPHTILLADVQSPAGGYTTAEITAFGQAFDTLGYALDVANFGAPSDVDGNGKIAILFTPGVNRVPTAPGIQVVGLFAARDLFASDANCPGSNEGEMFYLAVPDPDQVVNQAYQNKSQLAAGVLPTLVHEFQHLINGGRRLYVNDAPTFEQVWLNEGLSHIAEELLYYRMSGNSPRSNIDLGVILANQAQLDFANTYILDNLLDVRYYMRAPETSSPFQSVVGLETRGAIWQLLRYSADRKGGVEQTTWSSLVNTTLAGQANFNSVFGDIIANTRDWAVAQYADDAVPAITPNFRSLSWNFRQIMPNISGGVFPLLTHSLVGGPVSVTLNGGGAAYVRFGVAVNAPARISANSGGVAVPGAVDLMLMRTR